MKTYDELEKQIIMLYSDLLTDALTHEERALLPVSYSQALICGNQLAQEVANDLLVMKIRRLMAQGMRLGNELLKLEQRGMRILFPQKDTQLAQRLADLDPTIQVIFALGNEKLLDDPMISVVSDYHAFCQVQRPTLYLADRPLSVLARYAGVIQSLLAENTLIVSDAYRQGAQHLTPIGKKLNKAEVKKRVGKKVFISGSRTQAEIPSEVQKSLELIMAQRISVLIGDSEKGVDKEIIDYFRMSPHYPEVELFTIKSKPRVKLEPSWQARFVETDSGLKPQQQQMMKDRLMAGEADCGLAIFNPITKNRYGAIQVSSGTLRNTIQMLLEHKAVKFFYVYGGQLRLAPLKSIDGLRSVIAQYREETLSRQETEDVLSSKGVNPTDDPATVRHEKIAKKFEELLAQEQKIIRLSEQTSNAEQLLLFG